MRRQKTNGILWFSLQVLFLKLLLVSRVFAIGSIANSMGLLSQVIWQQRDRVEICALRTHS